MPETTDSSEQNTIRIRIDSGGRPLFMDSLSAVDELEVAHVSQQRWYYVDVIADDADSAMKLLAERIGSIKTDDLVVVTPGAPLDEDTMPPVG